MGGRERASAFARKKKCDDAARESSLRHCHPVIVMTQPWLDFLDPDLATLLPVLPPSVAKTALERVVARPAHDDDPRPRIESHGDYIFGVLVVPAPLADDSDVVYQEVDVVLTQDQLVTIRKTPVGGSAYDFKAARDKAVHEELSPGMCLYELFDEVAESYLSLVDRFDDDVDELEEAVETWTPVRVRRRISELRHDILHVRRVLAPMRDAARAILDDRVELSPSAEVFPRAVEIHFSDAYDKFLRATDGLELCRDLLAGVRDYHQAEVANAQNEVMKRLTVVASVLLLPTFIVGLYGQNLKGMPEYHFTYGYLWSWSLILLTTAGQIVYFRRKKWI